MYYPRSENKGADQLRGYRKADLRLCFRICKKPFSHDVAHLLMSNNYYFNCIFIVIIVNVIIIIVNVVTNNKVNCKFNNCICNSCIRNSGG